MARFHVSEDGQPRPCTAEKGACPLTEADGSKTPHGDFANAREAQAFAEKVNEKRYGGSFAAPKTSGVDRSKVKPALEHENFSATKAVAGGKLSLGLDRLDAPQPRRYEEFSGLQEFHDTRLDYDGYQIEYEVVHETFADSGKVLSSEQHFARATYDEESERASALNDLLTTADQEELESREEILREEWTGPNTRSSYRIVIAHVED